MRGGRTVVMFKFGIASDEVVSKTGEGRAVVAGMADVGVGPERRIDRPLPCRP